MSKICPNCQEVFDDSHGFCSSCGSRLVDNNNVNPALNLGDANAISGGININQSKNISTHDIHYHTMQERKKSEKELLQERKNKYYDEVVKLSRNGVITIEARAKLEALKFQLGIDSTTANQIEDAVKNEKRILANATNDSLSVIGKMAINSALTVINENKPQATNIITRLASICKTTMNEQVHFYYNMFMAAYEPQKCIEVYESRIVDSYWQAYWACLAYRKLEKDHEAEAIISEITNLWQNRPEIDVIICACVGIIMNNHGYLENCKEQIVEYLSQSEEKPSEELNDFYHALLNLVGLDNEVRSSDSFYKNKLFNYKDLTNYPIAIILPEEAISDIIFRDYDGMSISILAPLIHNQKGHYRELFESMRQEGYKKMRVDGKIVDINRGMKVNRYEKHDIELVVEELEVTENYKDLILKSVSVALKEGNGALIILDKAHDEIKLFKSQRAVEQEEEFKRCLEKAEADNAEAMYDLGDCYYRGWGVSCNIDQAIYWFEKAAEAGNDDAMSRLGDLYETGIIVDEDVNEAIKWYRKAAEKGNAFALYELVRIYGNGDIEDYNEAVKWFRIAAEEGDSEAMCHLGLCYENGNGVNQDYVEAAKWYRKAADAGVVKAMVNLGLCYENGNGINQDYAEAAKWYLKAADEGNARAMNNLGLCYLNGYGVRQNDNEAYNWFFKGAEAGDLTAMTNVGFCYEFGRGTEANPTEAMNWYQKALDNGHQMNDWLSQRLSECKAKLPSNATVEFPQAWVTQGDDTYITLHFHFVVHDHKDRNLSIKFLTESLSPNSTNFSNSIIFDDMQNYSLLPSYENCEWKDYSYDLYQSTAKFNLQYGNGWVLKTTMSVYDDQGRLLGSAYIQYIVNHESKMFRSDKLIFVGY